MKKAVIFAPFWRQDGHVGNNRMDRYVRWLAADGYHVVMIRAGSAKGLRNESWGTEITVRDPMGLYRDASPICVRPVVRKPNKLRRTLAYWLFNPDPSVVWAHAAARNPTVLEAAADAAFILSSNPPESAHVGAWMLSRRLGLPHIVDMRDGWLDEPLRPLLYTSAFRRWQEGRLEARILRNADAIQVTSDGWQELLCRRLPDLANKVNVLTNGYPLCTPKMAMVGKVRKDAGLVLVHAGRFLGSRLTQSPDLILQPLLEGIKQNTSQGTIKLIGSLSEEELKIIGGIIDSFANQGWCIECPGSLPRQELLELLPQADGLLLLSASYAAIPSKLFEYIPTGIPILVVTDRNSAVWRICEQLPQASLLEIREQSNNLATQRFFRSISNTALQSSRPNQYAEDFLSRIFLNEIDKILSK